MLVAILALMAKTAAERMADSRARQRGEKPALAVCKVCGKPLKATGAGRAAEMGLCHEHWKETPEGKAFLKSQRQLRRAKRDGPRPWRYFGALPDGDAYPEGPFNRLRLAVSSSYAGKGKERGKVWIVWTDDVVTCHEGIRQVDVGKVERNSADEVERSDLVLMARNTEALTERVRHYGHGDVYLV